MTATCLRQFRHLAFFALAGLVLAAGSATTQAAPPAGTVIGNQATATYNDAGGLSRTATSNLVQTTVTQVKSFTLTADGNRTVAAGATVYYPHTITNTGNGTDTYALAVPVTGGSFTHTGVAYYLDADSNGVPDNLTPITTSGPITLGGTFRFVVGGTVPGGATNGQTGTITVPVSDTNVPAPNTASNTDTTTVANSAITVTKALSVTNGPSPNAGPITVTITYGNTGGAAATNVQLLDTLPAGMTYIANSGNWSVGGALTDAPGGDPAGITYQFLAGQVIATITSVPAGFTAGRVTFNVQIAAGVAPGLINNVVQYQSTTQTATNSNTATYQVLQGATVTANGSTTDSTNGTAEPVTIPAAAAGSTINFTNVVWNLGNAPDSFDVAVSFPSGAWPAGTSFTLMQQDGNTALLDTNGTGIPDTGNIPLYAAGCPATFVADVANQRCGYRVILRVQLGAAASGGPFVARKTVTSRFDTTRTDTVDDVLTAIGANTVDVTNNASLPTSAANGAGSTGTTVITTNTVTPPPAGTLATRFQLYVNNAGTLADSYNLAVAGTPAGWTVGFRADGGAGNCSTLGAVLAGGNTGPVNANASRLVCAEVTVPAAPSGQAAPGTYNFDFTATSALNPAVTDVKRDAVTIPVVHAASLAPNNSGAIFAGGTITYGHTLTNLGNAPETFTFPAGFLVNSQPGWTAQAFIDNGNGVFDPGVDDVPANLIPTGANVAVLQPLAVNASRMIFVRVTAPAGALTTDPANLTTLTATFNAGASNVSATDTTSVIDGLLMVKQQRTVNCTGASPGVFSTAPLPAGPNTAAGQCLQYRIRATNGTGSTLTGVVISDVIPANTTQRNSCGAPATTIGTITAPGDGNPGTITATVGTLTAAQFADVSFCVRIN